MKANDRKIAVLLGGESAERDVSLMSGEAVLQSLLKQGFDAFPFDPYEFGFSKLVDKKIDKAFVMLHGRGGEDGVIQGALTNAKIPFTGSGVRGCALAMDKWRTKLIWNSVGIPTPKFLVINDDTNIEDVVNDLGMPLIIKPASEGSTIGLSKITKSEYISGAYKKAKEYDDIVLAEKWIDGIELTASILNNQALPLVQIEAPQGNYDYEAKYFSDKTNYICPTSLRVSTEKHLQQICLDAFAILGCEGWGRVDLMLDTNARPWLLEANTVPGMTNHSLVPMAAKAIGMSFDDLVLNILGDLNVE